MSARSRTRMVGTPRKPYPCGKSEIRISKSETNPKHEEDNPKPDPSSFSCLVFGFVSDFVFRISDFPVLTPSFPSMNIYLRGGEGQRSHETGTWQTQNNSDSPAQRSCSGSFAVVGRTALLHPRPRARTRHVYRPTRASHDLATTPYALRKVR